MCTLLTQLSMLSQITIHELVLFFRIFPVYRNAAFVRTHRHAAVVGRRRAVQSDAVGRSQYRLLQTPHRDRRSKNVWKSKSASTKSVSSVSRNSHKAHVPYRYVISSLITYTITLYTERCRRPWWQQQRWRPGFQHGRRDEENHV